MEKLNFHFKNGCKLKGENKMKKETIYKIVYDKNHKDLKLIKDVRKLVSKHMLNGIVSVWKEQTDHNKAKFEKIFRNEIMYPLNELKVKNVIYFNTHKDENNMRKAAYEIHYPLNI